MSESNTKVVVEFEIGQSLRNIIMFALSALLRIKGAPLPEQSPATDRTVGPGPEQTSTTETATTGQEQAPPPPETDTVMYGVELADGIPWDERIHSSNKKKYSKPPYKWMRKRGLSDALEAEVEAELRALMAAPAGGTPEQPAETSAEQAFGTETTAAGTEQAPPPPPPETETQTDAPEITNFVQLVQALVANKIDHTVTDPIIAKYGVQSLPLLGSRPDLIPSVVADLRALGLL